MDNASTVRSISVKYVDNLIHAILVPKDIPLVVVNASSAMSQTVLFATTMEYAANVLQIILFQMLTPAR